MKRAFNNQRPGVEKLRWQLIFALSGVGAVMASCSGRSSRTVNDDGTGGTSNAGRMSTTGGKGGNGSGGTGSSTGGSGGTNGGAGGTVSKGGSAGFAVDGGSSGSPGGGGNVMGGTAGFAGDIAGGGGVSGVSGDGGGSGDGPIGGSCNPGVSGQPGLCDGGFVHRPTAATCMLSERLDGTGQAGAPGAAGTGSVVVGECETDFDCTAASNGYCAREPSQVASFDLRCIYACAGDADCAAGSVCTCDNSYVSNVTAMPLAIGRCVSAFCTTDADCDPGRLCIAPVDSYCGPRRATAFHCQTPSDECAGPEDCGASLAMECAYSVDHYACLGKPACGRPFLVDGALRQSEAVTGQEWRDDELASALPVAVSLEARTAIAAHFAEAGLMEHASIAAFARFSLQLLALGAPPELVSACTAAMADETRHAQLCFGLASRYAGRSIAPGPLDVTGALTAVTLRDVVELVVHEGCIGETAAALEATWAAEAATDPLVREVLQGIAEDEGRHAALAFQFVAWAVEREPALAELVEQRVRDAQRAEASLVASDEETAPSGDLEAHGVLSPATRRAARRAALMDVLPGVVATALASARRTPGEDQERQERGPVLTRLAQLE